MLLSIIYIYVIVANILLLHSLMRLFLQLFLTIVSKFLKLGPV